MGLCLGARSSSETTKQVVEFFQATPPPYTLLVQEWKRHKANTATAPYNLLVKEFEKRKPGEKIPPYQLLIQELKTLWLEDIKDVPPYNLLVAEWQNMSFNPPPRVPAGKTVLLATQKAFAADAVAKIEKVLLEAKYKMKKLENYKNDDELLAAAADADAMIIRSDIVGQALLEKASNLKIVVRAGAGYDNIDLDACTVKGVVAMNTPGQNANAVGELAIAMMLTSARNNFDGTSGFELTGRRLAFYGFGAVARALHKLAKVFDMETAAYDPYIPKEAIAAEGATPVDNVEDLFTYQYVSLHTPLTPETKESINKTLLSKMPEGATLINTSRPEVVHEGDLLDLFKERSDFCYLADVVPKNVEEIKAALGDKFGKRAIFTKKKMGAQTLEANNNAGIAAANQIVNFFEKGDKKFQVNIPSPPGGPPAAKAASPKQVLLATEKAFAPGAVAKIEAVLNEAKYELKKIENYKSADELLKAVTDADAMIIRSDIVGAAVLEKAPQLKIVVRAGAGFDNIDLDACTAKGVVAMNTPGQNANAVAELTFGLMLVSARNNFDGTSGFELTGRRLAFYGFGAVARAVHKLAKVFDMETAAYDPYIPKEVISDAGATPVDKVEDLFTYQYVSLHTPLTDETKESINKDLLSKMPEGATLINTSRPEVVHEGDLLNLFKERSDFCYLADVVPKNVEEIKAALGDKFGKRAIFTKKKMGAQTLEANNNAGIAAANQIVGFFENGDVKFQVNK